MQMTRLNPVLFIKIPFIRIAACHTHDLVAKRNIERCPNDEGSRTSRNPHQLIKYWHDYSLSFAPNRTFFTISQLIQTAPAAKRISPGILSHCHITVVL